MINAVAKSQQAGVDWAWDEKAGKSSCSNKKIHNIYIYTIYIHTYFIIYTCMMYIYIYIFTNEGFSICNWDSSSSAILDWKMYPLVI